MSFVAAPTSGSRGARPGALGLAVAALALASCLDPTQATIEVSTNLPCGDEAPTAGALFETGFVAGSEASAKSSDLQATTRACVEPGGTVGSLVIYPQNGAARATVLVVGTIGDVPAETCLGVARGGPGDAASCIIARRSVAFIENESLHLGVLLDSRCAGVVCADGQTCVIEESQPVCASAEVTCQGSQCDPTGAGGGSSVTAGTGGSGAGPTGTGGGVVTAGTGGANAGGSGGGGPLPLFDVLPAPPGLNGARATGVSEDGAVVVGNAGNTTVPVAWRNLVPFKLDMAPRVASDACKSGNFIAGGGVAGGSPAQAWVWEATNSSYIPLWTSPTVASVAADCTTKGWVLSAETSQSFSLVDATTAMPLTNSVNGMVSEISDDGRGIVGGAGVMPMRPTLWSVTMTGLLTSSLPLSNVQGRAVAINHDATLAAGVMGANGTELEVWRLQPAVQSLFSTTSFVAEAIQGSATQWIVVGSCSGQHACVVVNGQGPFSIDGSGAAQWPATVGVDFKGVSLSGATDVSADGRVIVGWGSDVMSEVGWRLELPP